jgi:hypothetical protein
MGKLKTISSGIRSIDTRTTRPLPKQADPELLTEAHRRWRSEVLRRAGFRCEAVDGGKRCTVRPPARLFADHIIERRDGGDALDPSNGQCLCGSHHTRKTTIIRAARLAERPSSP